MTEQRSLHRATARIDIGAAPSRVWAALTDPDQIATYMEGARVESDWQVGSTITWTGEMDGRSFEDRGEVLANEEPRLLSVTHYSPLMGEPDAPENYHTITYTLTATDDGTHLELTQDNCTDEQQAEQFSQNWQRMFGELKSLVECSGAATT